MRGLTACTETCTRSPVVISAMLLEEHGMVVVTDPFTRVSIVVAPRCVIETTLPIMQRQFEASACGAKMPAGVLLCVIRPLSIQYTFFANRNISAIS